MDASANANNALSHDLFLIEIMEGDSVHYAVTERFLTIDPNQSALGIPWSELAALFKGRTLRAVPMPGRRSAANTRFQAGVSTEPGVSTNVEVNLVKIQRDD